MARAPAPADIADLPLALSSDPAPSLRPVPAAGVPLWMRPALFAGRWRVGLRRSVIAEASADPTRRRLVGITALAGLGVVLVGAVLHAMAPAGYPGSTFSMFGLGTHDLYSESVTFLLVAVFIGFLSPPAGALLVAALVPLDLIASLNQASELTPLPAAPIGRLVGYAVLWMLVVEGPVAARAVAQDHLTARPARAVALLVGSGAVAGLWVLAAPILLRPPFVWSALREPSTQAIASSQVWGWLLVLGALLGTGAALAWLHRGDAMLAASPGERVVGMSGWPGRIAGSLLGVVFLGGLVTSPLDVAVLFGILLGNAWLLERVSRTRGPRALAGLVVGVILGYLVASRVGSALYSVRPTEFFGLILAVGSAVTVANLVALGPSLVVRSKGLTVLLTAVGVGVLMLLFADRALADNCSAMSDCFGTAAAAGAAAGALGAGLVFGAAEFGRASREAEQHGAPLPPLPQTGPLDFSGWRKGAPPFHPNLGPLPPMPPGPIDGRSFKSYGAGIKA